MDDLESLDSLFSQPQENPPRKDKKPLIPGFSVILAALCICGLIFWAVWEEAKPPDAVLSTPTETTEATEPTDPAEPGTLPVYIPDYPMFSEKDPTASTAPAQYSFILDPEQWGDMDSYRGKYRYYATLNQERLAIKDSRATFTYIYKTAWLVQYRISGAILDPSQMVITFESRSTGEIVEQITLEITYDAKNRTYDIVLVDAIHTKTLFAYGGAPLQTDR